MTAEDTEVKVEPNRKPKSLLEKYEIPVTHLDFDYIRSCVNVKEIEKIVKILRSKDEGYYPDLLKCAEDKLRSLNCNHRLLRVDAPIMTKEALSKDDWKSITDDLEDWKGEVSSKEMVLNSAPKCNIKAYPEVRKSTMGIPKETRNVESKKSQRIRGSDYASWDKFDADTECLKLDLEEDQTVAEKEKKEIEKKTKPKIEKSIEEIALEGLVGSIEHMTTEEREEIAQKEKLIGNEFFNANNLNDAIKYYTRSIYIHPTCTVYANRTAAYLKQFKFNKALDDANKALELNPTDIKALYRRAIALQHKNEFVEALNDVRQVLIREPENVLARHLADQLRDNCASLPKKYKLRIQDKDHPDYNSVKDVTMEEMMSDYKDVNCIEVNDWGLPKIMCNCNGKYTHEPGMMHEIKINQRNRKNVTEIKTKKPRENAKRNDPETHSAKKIEIVELEKIVEEEKAEEQKKEPNKGSCLVVDKRKNHVNLDNELSPKPIKNQPICNGSKQNEDRSKFETKNDKTAKNINIQDAEETKARAPPDNLKKRPIKCSCEERLSLSNYNILDTWKSNTSLKDQANLLRSICPIHLSQVIGSNLEEPIVSNLFKCLLNQFDAQTEADTIRDYCQAIVQLNRFQIIRCFLSSDDIKNAGKLEKIAGSFFENGKN